MSGALSPSNQYKRPAGYAVARLIAGSSRYKPFNGYKGGDMNYAPDTNSAEIITLNFSAAPTDLSTISVPDAGHATQIFTFTYGGSPGIGVIPLVSGGGTAAQAATAAAAAFAQLFSWVITNPVAAQVVLVSKVRGINPVLAISDVVHISQGNSLASVGPVVPGRFGKLYCFFPAG